MGEKTAIEWTDATWNPLRGCSRVSEGCRHCYAELLAARFSKPGLWAHGFAEMTEHGPRWTGRVELLPSRLDLPLRWKEPRRIFVSSTSDAFHESLPDEAIDKIFAVMALAPRHTFQVLTKRPARMRAYLSAVGVIDRICAAARATSKKPGQEAHELNGWPLRHVHLGVSVEDQETADSRIPLLLETPAVVRFVSYEPALGAVDFSRRGLWLCKTWKVGEALNFWWEPQALRGARQIMLDWIIVGGESGPGARPFDVAWARSTITQCKAAGVACFVKQFGARPEIRNDEDGDAWPRGEVPFDDDFESRYQGELCPLIFRDRKGGDVDEWPEDLRVREFPR